MIDKLNRAAEVVLVECMGAKKGETVLVVSDEPLRELGLLLFKAARDMGTEAVYMEMMPRENHGVEPPASVAAAMKLADAVVIPTSKSLSHTAARKKASSSGARIATMPGITAEIMARTLSFSYRDIAERCRKYAEKLKGADKVEIKSPGGTSLTLSLKGRRAFADTGMLHSAGDFGNLPAGEVFIAPVEGTASGTLVVDGSMAGVGVLAEPIRMQVAGGFVTEITGGNSARELERILDKYGRDARNIAELGIGLNPRARLSGHPLEDEKVLGTVHIGLGDNSTFGGSVRVASHLDGIILNPTLIIDDRVLIEDGQLKED